MTNHFARRTKSDYLGEAFKKVCKIHARLPPGGVLVFLTGQQEIQALCKRLERRWSPKAIAQRKARREAAASRANRRDSDSEDSEEDEEIAPPPQALEAEDVDLGQEKDLTDDIDDRTASQEHDEEDLESDDENDEDDGLDQDEDMLEEESDGELYSNRRK